MPPYFSVLFQNTNEDEIKIYRHKLNKGKLNVSCVGSRTK